MKHAQKSVRNRLLEALSAEDLRLIEPDFETFAFDRGEVLFEPGEEVTHVYFPDRGMIGSFVMDLRNGTTTEAAMIGYEGAIGGIVSEGAKPAFARAVVQIPGAAIRIPTDTLSAAKEHSPSLRDHFARYADCLLAQVLQSVACNAVHDYDARLARWLLATQDRLGERRLPVTQQFVSEMLGVQRSYTSRVLHTLETSGAIETGRGLILIKDRPRLERQACECYAHLREHYDQVLPRVYPASIE